MTTATLTPIADAECSYLPDGELVEHRFNTGAPTCACGVEADLSHDWVVAALVHVPDKVAKHADFRGSFRTAENQRIDALDVYCHDCRRPYDDVADAGCEAKVDNTHLIGGDPGVRKKRKVYDPEGEVVAGPAINRHGTAAYVSGDAAPVG